MKRSIEPTAEPTIVTPTINIVGNVVSPPLTEPTAPWEMLLERNLGFGSIKDGTRVRLGTRFFLERQVQRIRSGASCQVRSERENLNRPRQEKMPKRKAYPTDREHAIARPTLRAPSQTL